MKRGQRSRKLLRPILRQIWGLSLICALGLLLGIKVFPGGIEIAAARSPLGPATLARPLVDFSNLPTPQTHPLPSGLAQLREPPTPDANGNIGSVPTDYFDQIQSTVLGYLVWSHFPITVFVEPADGAGAAGQRAMQWVAAVKAALPAWSELLPLQLIAQADSADIVIHRVAPPLRVLPPEPGDRAPRLRLDRARSAETRYEFLTKALPQGRTLLSHRYQIWISPNLSPGAIAAAARHELGHALGIWGHSPYPEDVMYFSQVQVAPLVSPRDAATLKRIYQQPTRLGWPLTVANSQT